MSGGSMEYICYKIEEYSADLCDHELTDLAKDMAEVYHDAEWWHSGDIFEETYRKTVAKFKKKWLGSAALAFTILATFTLAFAFASSAICSSLTS